MRNRFKINIKDFKFIEKIQEGGFSSVCKVQDIKTNFEYAAKIINDNIDDENIKKMVNREIGIMMRFHHPTLVTFIGYSLTDFSDKNHVTIIMDLYPNKSLADVIKNTQQPLPDAKYDNTAKQIILIGIARGMMYLHQHNVIHRDLKPGNILIDSNFHPHIADFGLSKVVNANLSTTQSQLCGTSIYMAPETVSSDRYSGKSDVYSFGILMYEVVTNLAPFPLFQKKQMSFFQFIKKVIDENDRPKFPESIKVKPAIKSLIECCWSKDPNERPTFEEIFKKLSYNNDNSIYDVCDNNGDEFKYYLDDVNVDDVLTYADSLNENDQFGLLNEIEKLSRRLESIEKFNEQLKVENDELRKENKQIKESFDNYQTENRQLQLKYISEVNSLKNENEKLRIDIEKVQQMQDEIDNKEKETNQQQPQQLQQPKQQEKFLTIGGFNELSLKAQQAIVSKLGKSSQQSLFTRIFKGNDPIFNNLNNLLLFLIKFVKNPDEAHWISIASINSKQRFDSLKNKDQNFNNILLLLPNATEILYQQGCLNSPEFIQLLKAIEPFSIEMRYPSEFFNSIYETISNIKKIEIPQIRMSILINGINETNKEFMHNTDITYFNIESVNSIGDSSFYECLSLIQVAISEGVTSIGSSSFCGCSSLKYITIPSSVKLIGNNAFNGCSSLKNMTIPSSVTSLGYSAFEDCCSLQQISIPSSLTAISESAFCGCSSLKQIVIPNSIISIGDTAFCECTSLNQITIPSSVTSIGKRCFYKCSSLKQIVIPQSVMLIDVATFENCSNLSKVLLPSSLVGIGSCCFAGCSALTEITIPFAVTEIGNGAFSGCSSLAQIFIHPSLSIKNIGLDEKAKIEYHK